MKKLTVSIVTVTVAALVGTSAFAADMAVKAPPPAPAPVYRWTGWYVGASAGYGWSGSNVALAASRKPLLSLILFPSLCEQPPLQVR